MSNPFETIDRRLSAIEDVLQELRARSQPTLSSPPAEERPVSVKETAAFLNKKEATIYGLVYEKKIPHHKPDGTGNVYFFLSELSEWVKNGRKVTTEELDEQVRQQIATRINRRNQSKERKGGRKVA